MIVGLVEIKMIALPLFLISNIFVFFLFHNK